MTLLQVSCCTDSASVKSNIEERKESVADTLKKVTVKEIKGTQPDISKTGNAKSTTVERPSGPMLPRGTGKPKGSSKPVVKR